MVHDFEPLAQLLPPPATDVARPPWSQSRGEIGLAFPTDYTGFVDRYGGGVITSQGNAVEFLVHAPSTEVRRSGLSGFGAFLDETTSQVRFNLVFDGSDEEVWYGDPYPVLPDPGGLLAWGETSVGDLLFWSTQDPNPDRWPVVIWPRHVEVVYHFEGGMLAFLLAVLRGEHPAHWLAGEHAKWTMRNDWLQSGLDISSGPAR